MSILIIEGSDAVGKTTLIEYLRNKIGYSVLKGSSFEIVGECKDSDELYDKFLDLLYEAEELDGVIFDRYIYSNSVYASLYKDYTILNYGDRHDLEQMMKYNDVHIIYLYADPNTIKQRLESRGDDYVKSDMIEPILQKYNEVLLTVDKDIPILSFDTGVMTTEDIGNHIVENILKGEG